MVKITVITSLFHCIDYLEPYLKQVSKVQHIEECEFLLLHNEPSDKEINIINQYKCNIPQLKHIIIPQRESLYATWNRGCKMAEGNYIAIWNVDDVRTPDSLLKQSYILDHNIEAMYAYGIYTCIKKYGDIIGKVINEPDTTVDIWAKTHRHLGGCFPMWRKSVHQYVGYFDEQLRLVGDLDFQIRIGINFPFIKVNEMLGYYLMDNPNRLSKNAKLQAKENNFVYRRYKLYSLIDPLFSLDKDIHYLLVQGKKETLKQLCPNIKSDIPKRKYQVQCIIKFPYFLLRYLKHHILHI